MKIRGLFCGVGVAVLFVISCKQPADCTKQVNVFVCTDFHGHTSPGATMPHGMVQLSPDTRTETWDGDLGYHYSDSNILGFSHIHNSGVGCAGGAGDGKKLGLQKGKKFRKVLSGIKYNFKNQLHYYEIQEINFIAFNCAFC